MANPGGPLRLFLVVLCVAAVGVTTALAAPSLGGGQDQAASAKKKCKKKKCKKKKVVPPQSPPAGPPPDTTAPNTEITGGPDGPTGDNTPSFTFTSTETPATFTCQLDTAPAESCSSPKLYDVEVGDGPHTFTVVARDSAGNADPTPATRMFTVDATGPVITITNPASDGTSTNDTTPSFTFASEPGATFTCQIDSGAAADCPSAFTPAAPLSEGPHTLIVTGTDAVGNTGQATRTFTVDTTPPDVTITSPGADGTSTNDTTPAFHFFSSESAGFRCQIDSGTPVDCTSPFSPTDPLSESSHTLTIHAFDAAGNSDPSPATRTFTVDATPPEVTITSPATDGTSTNDSTPTFTFTNTGATDFRCQIDSGAAVSCTSPFTPTSPVSDGSHTLTVFATDPAGNFDSDLRTFTVDTVAPDVTITSPTENAFTSDSTPEFTFTSTESASFRCQIDSGTPADCTSPFSPTTPLSDGQHTLTVTATDAAGNSDLTPATRMVRVDTTAPTTTINTGPTPGQTVRATSVTFGFSSNETATFQCKLASLEASFSSCVSTKTYNNLPDGNYTFSVFATDAAGNSDQTPETRSFTIFLDQDNDGYSAQATSASQRDCNDGNVLINPGMPETTGNQVDENCNGSLLN